MDFLLQQKGKINNSYESEPSLTSGSSASENNDFRSYDDENVPINYLLKPSTYDFEQNFEQLVNDEPPPVKHADPLSQSNASIRYDSSQNSLLLGFGGSPTVQKDDILPIYSISSDESLADNNPASPPLVIANFAAFEENSSNAVDIKIGLNTMKTNSPVNTFQIADGKSQEFSFNGRIASKNPKETSVPSDKHFEWKTQNLGIFIASPNTKTNNNKNNLNSSNVSQNISETSFLLNTTRSPDLFADDDDVETAAPQRRTSDDARKTDSKKTEVISVQESYSWLGNEQTIDGHNGIPVSKSTDPDDDNVRLYQENCHREKELLRRIRKCLSGLPPPPSVTIPSLDLMDRILTLKQDILDFPENIKRSLHGNEKTDSENTSRNNSEATSIFRPTHSFDETMKKPWKDILGVRFHGLHYNINEASEHNEYLSLSVIERFIGAETNSSYRYSPSSAKKRNARLKLLTQSPGNRLSHLAKRRAMFSSANLASSSQRIHGPQIIIDKKKNSKHRRKATPKRKTPGSKKKVRKTPSSSARKKLGPSRETSKRALFQSPVRKSLPQQSVLPKSLLIKPEIANRVEKSKRALFSSCEYNDDSSSQQMKPIHSGGSNNSLETLLKRKRVPEYDDDYLDNTQASKMFRGDTQGLTPRALKIKSQSFCAGAGSFSNANFSRTTGQYSTVTSQTDLLTNSKSSFTEHKLQRAQSETTAQSVSLTDNQKKKLLWAVSQALQEKKITSQHDNFKQFASTLARVVRRIFQEYYHSRSTSNSETMLRLSKKYVYNVLTGKTADEIYIQAKIEIEENKSTSVNRLSGYIDREEYTKLKMSQEMKASRSSIGNFTSSRHSINDISQLCDDHNSRQPLASSKAEQTSFAVSHSVKAYENANLKTQLSSAISAEKSSEASGYKQSSEASISSTQTEVVDHKKEGDGSLDLENQSSAYKHTKIQSNSNLQNSSSKNNLGDLALRENVHCDQRQQHRSSAQKLITSKYGSNTRSPFSTVTNEATTNEIGEGNSNSFHSMQQQIVSSLRTSSISKSSPTFLKQNLQMIYGGEGAKAKRQIIFDS